MYSLYDVFGDFGFCVLFTVSVDLLIAIDETTTLVPSVSGGRSSSSRYHVIVVMYLNNNF